VTARASRRRLGGEPLSAASSCLVETAETATFQQPSAALREAREAIMFARRLAR
jgi:hypothetical protein